MPKSPEYNLSAAHLLVGVASLLELVVQEIVIMEWMHDFGRCSSYELPR
ncbi:MAG TPA: hypothetical protein VFB81_01310 [Myxococcales bacterium]|nr:hypothetical protein [Myxococcales bacterium]